MPIGIFFLGFAVGFAVAAFWFLGNEKPKKEDT